MIVPKKARSYSASVQMGSEIYQVLRALLIKKYGSGSVNVGDEGGFAPPVKNSKDALDIITKAIDHAGYSRKVFIALDMASSEFYHKKKYHIDGKKLNAEKLASYIVSLCKQYPIVSVEDPFDQEDFESFAHLTSMIGKHVQIVGDDLLCTNLERIRMALHYQSCNALLLKVNQIGTLSESLGAHQLSLLYDWHTMVSHRSGETTDTFIADLAVGLGCGQIKSGAPCRGERVAKYNQLLRIEEELGRRARYGK